MRLGIVVAVAFLISASEANADYFVTGNNLLEYCDASPQSPNSQKWFQCLGYVQGVVDAMAGGMPVMSWTACLDEHPGLVAQQFIDIAVNYLRAHPESRQAIASSLVAASISGAFPCKK